MAQWAARSGNSLGFMSREPVASFGWHKPRISRHAFLEIQLPGSEVRVFGVHLSAVHAAWTERRRTLEFRALLKSIAQHQHGLHLLAGDFNTLAPGELLDLRKLPSRLRALVWLSGGSRAMAHDPDHPRRRIRRHLPEHASGRAWLHLPDAGIRTHGSTTSSFRWPTPRACSPAK